MNKVLTITIPAYNVQEYLNKTLDTICECSNLDNIEVLVVNDGSKDNTANIGNSYVKKYPQAVRVVNKENGGHGSTINRGIEEATGKYFKVIDGDDWVDSMELERLVEALNKQEADLIISPRTICNVETGENTITECRELIGVNNESIVKYAEVIGDIFQIHAVTFRTDVLRQANIKITERCFYVDQEYVCFPLSQIRTISYIDTNVYKYRIGRKDQSINWDNMIKNSHMHIMVLKALISDYNTHVYSHEVDNLYRFMISRLINEQYLIFLKMNSKEGFEKMKDFQQFYLHNFGKTSGRKSSTLLEVSPAAYWALAKIKG